MQSWWAGLTAILSNLVAESQECNCIFYSEEVLCGLLCQSRFVAFIGLTS